MKKTVAILLVVCLCIGLCACGKENAAQIEYPEGWDRIAEATKFSQQFLNCKTVEDVRSIAQDGMSEEMMVSYILNDPKVESYGILKLIFAESYRGCDIFILRAEGQLNESSASNMSNYCIELIMPLVIENGQYVIPVKDLSKRIKKYEICAFCLLGDASVTTPCTTCDGTGSIFTDPDIVICPDCDHGNVHVGFEVCTKCDGQGFKIR